VCVCVFRPSQQMSSTYLEWVKPNVADLNGGMTACCTAGPIVFIAAMYGA